MIEQVHFHSIRDALHAAGRGVLYAYTADSAQAGWLKSSQLPRLEWYEKLVVTPPATNALFLEEAGVSGDPVLLAIGHGFVLSSAAGPSELAEAIRVARAIARPIIDHLVRQKIIDPATFGFG